jgi:serine/threonine protein kinase
VRVSHPEKLQAITDETKVRQEMQRRAIDRFDELTSHWGAFRDAERSLGGDDERQRRAARTKEMRLFLQWCDKAGHEYLKPGEDKRTQDVYEEIKASLKDLNTLLPGSEFEGRIVGKMLGAGQFGSVYRTTRMRDGGDEVLKVFHSNNFDQRDVLATRFRTGFESMDKLSHRRIPKVRGFSLVPRAYFIDYVDGFDLGHVLEQEQQPGLETASSRIDVLLKILQIVSDAHAQGVIHRDIKPENILMGWDAESNSYDPWVTDFDLAWYRQAVSITLAGADIGGSFLYAAPEQKRATAKESLHEPTVDVYAAGKLLAFVMTNRQPDMTPSELMEQIRGRFKGEGRISALAQRLGEVYKCATDSSPKARYQSIETLMWHIEAAKEYLVNDSMPADLFVFELGAAARLPLDDRLKKMADSEKLELNEFGVAIAVDLTGDERDGIPVSITVVEPQRLTGSNTTFDKARKRANDRIEKLNRELKMRVVKFSPGGKSDVYKYTTHLERKPLTEEFKSLLLDYIRKLQTDVLPTS